MLRGAVVRVLEGTVDESHKFGVFHANISGAVSLLIQIAWFIPLDNQVTSIHHCPVHLDTQ